MTDDSVTDPRTAVREGSAVAGGLVYALAPLGAATLWGGMYVVSAWGFSKVPPMTLGFLRIVIGAGTLLAVVGVNGHDPLTRRDWLEAGGLGVLVAVTIATQFLGTHLTNASQGSLITILTPVFTVVLGATVLGERVGTEKRLGLALAVVGTAVVLAGQYSLSSLFAASGTGAVLGVAGLLVASAAWAVYTVFGAPFVRRHSALVAATYATVLSTPLLALGAAAELLVLGRGLSTLPTSPSVVAAVLYLGVGATAGAWYLWYKGLEYVDSGTVAVFFFVQPLVGTALGALLLGDDVGLLFFVGGVVMGVGVLLVSRARG